MESAPWPYCNREGAEALPPALHRPISTTPRRGTDDDHQRQQCVTWWAWNWSKSSRKEASSRRLVCLCVCPNFESGYECRYCWSLRFPSPPEPVFLCPHVPHFARVCPLCWRICRMPTPRRWVAWSAACRLPTADCRLPTADCRFRANANWHISHRVRVWIGARNRRTRAEVRRGPPLTEQKLLVEPSRALLGAWQAGDRSSPSARGNEAAGQLLRLRTARTSRTECRLELLAAHIPTPCTGSWRHRGTRLSTLRGGPAMLWAGRYGCRQEPFREWVRPAPDA